MVVHLIYLDFLFSLDINTYNLISLQINTDTKCSAACQSRRGSPCQRNLFDPLLMLEIQGKIINDFMTSLIMSIR